MVVVVVAVCCKNGLECDVVWLWLRRRGFQERDEAGWALLQMLDGDNHAFLDNSGCSIDNRCQSTRDR